MQLETVKVVHPGTGLGYMIINKSDFNPEEHELFETVADDGIPTRAKLDGALAALPGEYTDPEYVVRGMKAHFGPLFTADDEALVRERVKPDQNPAASALGQNMTIADLKVALDAKGITYKSNASKPELLALFKATPVSPAA